MPAPTTSPLANPTGITVSATSFPITIGAGGSAGSNGSNSVFSPITSAGGGSGKVTPNGIGGPGGSGGGGRGGPTSTSGYAGGTGNTPSVSPTQGNNGGAGYDSFKETYPNHVFGPLNVIKQTLVRESGLNFTQEFKLKFEYELRDLGGANPKLLMLDKLAHMLALTYNNAPFWGGSVRYIGDGSVARPLGDVAKLKNGDYGGFMKSVVSSLTGKNTGNPLKDITEGIGDFVKGGGIGKTLDNLGGGALMKLFNSPQGGQAVAALLSGDPTGQWHVTIGNPLNPIAVIGNLACTDTSIKFEGPMGLQDFPEKMVVEITLKPGRPRDKAEIESMFNAGRGRFYLQPKDGIDINSTIDVNAYGKTQTTPIDDEMRNQVNG